MKKEDLEGTVFKPFLKTVYGDHLTKHKKKH